MSSCLRFVLYSASEWLNVEWTRLEHALEMINMNIKLYLAMIHFWETCTKQLATSLRHGNHQMTGDIIMKKKSLSPCAAWRKRRPSPTQREGRELGRTACRRVAAPIGWRACPLRHPRAACRPGRPPTSRAARPGKGPVTSSCRRWRSVCAAFLVDSVHFAANRGSTAEVAVDLQERIHEGRARAGAEGLRGDPVAVEGGRDAAMEGASACRDSWRTCC